MEDRPRAELTDWQMQEAFEEFGILYPSFCKGSVDTIKDGNVPDYEVLIATYPRSGTSKLIEVCWLLLHDINIEKAKATDVMERYMSLEALNSPAQDHSKIKPPVVAKTHFPFHALKKLVERQKKIIVGIRNPKDTLVSYYHFNRMNKLNGRFPGNWGQFLDLYKRGKFLYGDYFDFIMPWWDERHRENILFVMYEDLVENAVETIQKIAQFLGKQYSEDGIRRIAEWTSFENIQNQPSSNYTSERVTQLLDLSISKYMRKGTPGDWKNYLSENDNKYIDSLCEKIASPKGLFFTFK